MLTVFDGFNEAKMTSLCSGFPEDKDSFTEAYDYDNDSDLEYDPEASEEDLHEGTTGAQCQCVSRSCYLHQGIY